MMTANSIQASHHIKGMRADEPMRLRCSAFKHYRVCFTQVDFTDNARWISLREAPVYFSFDRIHHSAVKNTAQYLQILQVTQKVS